MPTIQVLKASRGFYFSRGMISELQAWRLLQQQQNNIFLSFSRTHTNIQTPKHTDTHTHSYTNTQAHTYKHSQTYTNMQTNEQKQRNEFRFFLFKGCEH